ncbi:hypothetical protein TGAM01_v208334 [Trichoderma gamsii]|uniref:Uncharacterized protein n=1 Tax=Trichoderma gamsii TaxID=398673 RepID=A0A2P4ZEY3_9HYPO|nr:hypothetical protein TGAM01_v208334 [Trichoderma gamsii]PON22854.1 hypothetical protein TGAM01_v208334 [Trichoderma gamsii]
MLAKNDEFAVQIAHAASAEWEIEPDATPENAAQYKIVTACFTTTVLNILTTWFEKEPGNTRWKTSPICDGWGLQERVRLVIPTGEHNLCEICLLAVAVLTCLHWSCVFSLFCQRRWQDNFLPGTIVATFVTLLPIATFVQDQTWVFLGVLPIVIDVFIAACAVIDYIDQKRFFPKASDTNII